ncbi:hypothetical protein CMI42_00820 [Candidatus Pacearchaeota archaeon]|jgi:hypothetical protein|nr:hypothetical protein [Candidatus Pacearchaeota archaeon]|tara:strand:+ start:344 stop:676 length:333 start_codon:yes stop_codon:yes gene_type:complete
MKPVEPADEIIFANPRFENEYAALHEEDWLRKALNRALERLKGNVLCGERISKKLIPKGYVKKYDINNLFWYQLPNAWRLVYSVLMNRDNRIVMIIEYFDHKEYERRFRY